MSVKKLFPAALLLLTAACALTPEQQAQREATRQKREQALQVQLAAQCDKDTAELMRRQFEQPQFADEKERRTFRTRYLDKVSDPMFQACYKLAWENHIAQQRLRRIERYYDRYDDFYPPFYRPWWYW